jgi:lipoate-protein ligase A
LLDTGGLPASLNMAIDQAILEMHTRGESPATLRFYQWSPPAVSLGYFQRRHSIDPAACRKAGIDVVRRPTGGRAVLHLNDLTYSVVAGVEEGIPRSLQAAYRLLCEGLLAGFRTLGFEAESGHETTRSSHGDICFMRTAIGDIVYQGKKFLGNAQTWAGSSMLQHGSIVLAPQGQTWTKILKPGIPKEALEDKINARTTSLEEILCRSIKPDEIKAALTEGMGKVMRANFPRAELSYDELRLAKEIASGQTDEVPY